MRQEVKTVPYNPDLKHLLDNLESMITTLSQLEVKHKRNPQAGPLTSQREKVSQAIDYYNKMFMIHKIMN